MGDRATNSTAVPNRTTNDSNPGSEDMDGLQLQLQLIITFLVVLGCLIVCINSYVVYLVAKVDRLKTVTNFCLASMAMSDMLSGLVVIPLIAWCNLVPSEQPAGDVRPLAMDLVQRFLSISTILHLLLITLERYITIVHTFSQSSALLGKRLCVVILLGLWAFSLVASLIQLTFLSEHQGDSDITYDIVMLVGIVVLPLLVMMFAYGHIFHTLKRHCKNIKREISHLQNGSANRYRQKERRAIMIYGTMLIVFVIGWFNYFFTTLQNDLGGGEALPIWASAILMFLRFSTSFLNPLLYAFLKDDFKRARKSIQLCPCARRYRPVARNRSTTRIHTLATAASTL